MRGRPATELLALTVRLRGIQLFYRRHSRRLADCGYTDAWIDGDGSVHEAQSAA